MARLAAILALALLAGCGGSPAGRPATPAHAGRPTPVRLKARELGRLPAPVQLPAAAVLPRGGAVVLGGLSSQAVSTPSALRVDGTRVRRLPHLPLALHDAAAATLGGDAYLFGGGGSAGSIGAILRLGTDGHSVSAGRLPVPSSDLGAAAVGDSAYVVGGYDGSRALGTIVRFRPGSGAAAIARLPAPARYPAVAAVGKRLLVAGGQSPVAPTRAVWSFDPATRHTRRLATLPVPLAHATAAALGGRLYVIGGRSGAAGNQTDRVLAVDPSSGRVTSAGRLPRPLSDAAAVTEGGRIVVFGGRYADGSASDRVLALEPRR